MAVPALQQPVRDLLRIRHSHVVGEHTLLRDVAERLIISDCDVMAVVDDQQRLIGIVCETSVVRALLASPGEDATICSIITRHAESVKTDAPLNSVLPHFRSAANTALPVVDADGRVCGLLMRRDVIGTLIQRPAEQSQVVPGSTPAIVIRDTNIRRPQFIRPGMTIDPGNSQTHQPSGPHFLRADAARRLLWAAEDRL